MKAICTTAERKLEVRETPLPTQPAPEHMLVEIAGSGINPGDIIYLKREMPPGVPLSLFDVWGVSGAGTVVAVGEGIAPHHLGKRVALYRSLISSNHTIGMWCQTAEVHHSTCVILPDDVDPIDYAGSLVNTITPYAFLKQAQAEQHRGVIVTAGTSATGIAMLGIALAYAVPIISIVRSEIEKEKLVDLGAETVLVLDDTNFDRDFASAAEKKKATAIFDGVGGDMIMRVAALSASGSTIYSYGQLGGNTPVSLPTLKRFSNFRSPTVQDSARLDDALGELSKIIGMPHFKTKRGKSFRFEEIGEAIAYRDKDGGKAILVPDS